MSDETVSDYELGKAWDEMYASGEVRRQYESVLNYLKNTPTDGLKKREQLASQLFMSQGITFTVYNSNKGIERIFPFDLIPRIITCSEWEYIESGIKQRLKALNMFLKDVYSDQQIIKDGIIPEHIITSCPHYLKEMKGIKVPHDIYVHIAGIDLIRNEKGSFCVLEDNLRTPSGVSYMIENREITKRVIPKLFAENPVHAVEDYPLLLSNVLKSVNPHGHSDTHAVLLTPGRYNSAYFEHSFLARSMGMELVEGPDLLVRNNKVYSKTTMGLKQVDVIYRRIDDEYLDPQVFLKDSLLGVPGIMKAYASGNVAIANAVGNGVADDKLIYAFVPQMIRYYLNEQPVLDNIDTYQLGNKDQLEYALNNMEGMVFKRTNQSGGYGMVMGNSASPQELEEAAKAIRAAPRDFIAQPIINLSTAPCYIDNKLQARHVDLRPYALCGPDGIQIVPGGLTRVALRKGSLVVNSSQGGGSKDTWVLSDKLLKKLLEATAEKNSL